MDLINYAYIWCCWIVFAAGIQIPFQYAPWNLAFSHQNICCHTHNTPFHIINVHQHWQTLCLLLRMSQFSGNPNPRLTTVLSNMLASCPICFSCWIHKCNHILIFLYMVSAYSFGLYDVQWIFTKHFLELESELFISTDTVWLFGKLCCIWMKPKPSNY